jgi:hypothetical protein
MGQKRAIPLLCTCTYLSEGSDAADFHHFDRPVRTDPRTYAAPDAEFDKDLIVPVVLVVYRLFPAHACAGTALATEMEVDHGAVGDVMIIDRMWNCRGNLHTYMSQEME